MKFREAIDQKLIRIGASVSIALSRPGPNKCIMGKVVWLSEREFGISRFDGIEGTGLNKTWRFNILGDTVSDITFLADTGYPPLLYEVKIADKPQGHWRPRVTIEFSPVINSMNISPIIILGIIREGIPSADMATVSYTMDLPLYQSASRWKGQAVAGVIYIVDIERGIQLSDDNNNPICLDWRPGLKPSYADYAAHFKRACDLVVKEYDRRCREALGSGISDPITVTPDSPEDRKEVTRKIRILNQE